MIDATTVYTIGHGNRPLEELVELLKQNGVGCLVDVRMFPGSRRHPHFGRGELEKSLPKRHIEYVWEGQALGGRRRARKDTPHVAMRNESFRAYADHMQSAEFHEGIARLLEIARDERPAIMCAERLPWQCHRYMISDFLVAHGVEVRHVIGPSGPKAHALRTEARIEGDDLIYDVGTQPGLDIG
ncbi:MAG TPA: DUF488 domain-containing protein [Burkholderiales bacterium]|nr:DUF488 domain-containing protein [Burkholderiales bacterium]